MPDRKRVGCCTLCDEPIFEVAARHTEGPSKGEIKQMGGPLPGARRVTLVRMSGRTSYCSLCKECEVTSANIVVVTQKEVAAMVHERNFARDTMEQAENRERMLRLFAFDVPLGVLGETPWSEVT
jgi:predicted secreted Zn-dependent protease